MSKKPSGKEGARDEYFMDQKTMRRARWESAVMLSIAKRSKRSKGRTPFVSFYGKCGCGCGPVGTVRYER